MTYLASQRNFQRSITSRRSVTLETDEQPPSIGKLKPVMSNRKLEGTARHGKNLGVLNHLHEFAIDLCPLYGIEPAMVFLNYLMSTDDFDTRLRARFRRLIEDGFDNPTLPEMFSRLSAMAQDAGVRATALLKGIGKDRQVVECPVNGDALGNLTNDAIVPIQGGRAYRLLAIPLDFPPFLQSVSKKTSEEILARLDFTGDDAPWLL